MGTLLTYLSFETCQEEGKMGKFARIVLPALFLVMGNIGIGYCDPGNGGGWGQGSGGGKGHGVPEIGPSLAPSAIALLSCGVLILTDKCRRRQKPPK